MNAINFYIRISDFDFIFNFIFFLENRHKEYHPYKMAMIDKFPSHLNNTVVTAIYGTRDTPGTFRGPQEYLLKKVDCAGLYTLT